jgi:hypothetical protein
MDLILDTHVMANDYRFVSIALAIAITSHN